MYYEINLFHLRILYLFPCQKFFHYGLFCFNYFLPFLCLLSFLFQFGICVVCKLSKLLFLWKEFRQLHEFLLIVNYMLRCIDFWSTLPTLFRKKKLLKWISQFISQTVHTNFANGAKNINIKNLSKCAKQIKQNQGSSI